MTPIRYWRFQLVRVSMSEKPIVGSVDWHVLLGYSNAISKIVPHDIIRIESETFIA